MALSRRRFIAGSAAVGAAGALASPPLASRLGPGATAAPAAPAIPAIPAVPSDATFAALPTEDVMMDWVGQMCSRGVRLPGYPAGIWTEDFIESTFRDLGLEGVYRQPVQSVMWTPLRWSVEAVTPDGAVEAIDAWPIPYGKPTAGVEEYDLVDHATTPTAGLRGKAVLCDHTMRSAPADVMVHLGPLAREDPPERIYDPDGELGEVQHFPTGDGPSFEAVDAAGGGAFIGTLVDYLNDSCRYFLPYWENDYSMPAVWVRESGGRRLRALLAEFGTVRIQISVESAEEEVTTYNIVGELPGADDELVMVGSHHDGPWASAVEDAAGVALTLAQATYWAAQPQAQRPHRLVFSLNAGHMYDGAGLWAFVDARRSDLPRTVLEVHLEHAGREVRVEGDELVLTGRCVPRWIFSSRIPQLEQAIYDALVRNDLRRSMILDPEALSDAPPTDGSAFYREGVPIVHLAPPAWYLFDEQDTPDKVDRENLVALSKAFVEIIRSTTGVSAAQMRSWTVTSPPTTPSSSTPPTPPTPSVDPGGAPERATPATPVPGAPTYTG